MESFIVKKISGVSPRRSLVSLQTLYPPRDRVKCLPATDYLPLLYDLCSLDLLTCAMSATGGLSEDDVRQKWPLHWMVWNNDHKALETKLKSDQLVRAQPVTTAA